MRFMAKIISTKTHTSGMALGGIGSGTVELLPDGEFHYWQIANPPRFTTVAFESKVDDGEGSTGALSFYVRCERNSHVVLRKLGMKTEPEDFTYRMFAWNKPVEEIEFNAQFPVCELKYNDAKLPCNVSIRAVAPFVPHNTDASSTPGFYLDFVLENPTDEELRVSLMGTLKPDFANREEGFRNSHIREHEYEGIFLQAARITEDPACGNLCFTVSGAGEKSYITAEYDKFIREYISCFPKYGVTQESVLFGYREKGRLPNTDVGERPEDIPDDIGALSDEEAERLFCLYCRYPFALSLLNRIRYTLPNYPVNRSEVNDFLAYLKEQLRSRITGGFGSCGLCSTLALGPREKKEVRFVFSWYFPNHFAPNGKRLGHYYENLFPSSLEVNKYLSQNRSEIHDKALRFKDILFNTDLPVYYPESWSSHLATIIKSSWYLKDGKFGLWEGLGYCGFHTTDITYHASFGLLALFPELQKRQMRMGAQFQREDGRVHHFFTPDLEHVDNGFDRVDMNNQFVLMVLRDYLFTGDREYLSALWMPVQRAMDSIKLLDTDGDGLPDNETCRNTYDAWNFSGTPTYISVLWLAALKAAVIIAERMGDESRSTEWATLLERGKASLEEKLWNGKYYDLWVNGNDRDKTVMTDQLDGEWFLRMMGIGGNLSDDRVRTVIRFIWEQNFDEESGLTNASEYYPHSNNIHSNKNCQAEAVWTGIGYVFAALALAVGCKDIADAGVRSIHDNQFRFGAFWDHWECGHHYTRPLSSWTTMNAALGLYVDSERKIIRLDPPFRNITLPLLTAELMGTVHFREGLCKTDLEEGDLSKWEIILSEGIVRG